METGNKADLQVQGSVHIVRVNNHEVHRLTDMQQAKKMVERLNRIFRDKARDLDFITPTFVNKQSRGEIGPFYAICCPPVRDKIGVTHFHPSGRTRPLNRFLYQPDNWTDSENVAEQTAIVGITSANDPTPWLTAIKVANKIRKAIKLHFQDASGKRKQKLVCYPLHQPDNETNTTLKVIAPKAGCRFYGHPCQGKKPGTHSSKCPEINKPENVKVPYTTYFPIDQDYFEILHGQDLTCAVKVDWFNKYKNKFLRVTNLKSGQSIVVKVTDINGSFHGVELTDAAWRAIGKPEGVGKVKIEVLK